MCVEVREELVGSRFSPSTRSVLLPALKSKDFVS